MPPLSKFLARLLCLTTLASAAGAQELPLLHSERLKKKIESVNQIYRRTLRRQYEEYVASLRQDIESLRESKSKVGDASDAAGELDAGIAKLTGELRAAEESLAALKSEAGEGRAEASPAREQPAGACGAIPADKLPPGTFWCAAVGGVSGLDPNGPKLPLRELAERAAPILWFSPDEPLRPRKKIPEPLPGDKSAGAPVVYYRVSRIMDEVGGNKKFKADTADEADLFLKGLNEVTIRYFFYYSEDKGLHGHVNDLESLALDISFTRMTAAAEKAEDEDDKVAYYVAHLKTAVGAAHGVAWFNNELDIGEDERDVSLPLTVLVEQGKHATAPDRNADGVYSPGYDVNRRYEDAWGVRDLIGSGQLGGSKYEASMTKPRRPSGMLLPRVGMGRAEMLKHYTGPHKSELMEARDAYELRTATPGLIEVVKKSEDGRKGDLEKRKEAGEEINVKKAMGMNVVKTMERDGFNRPGPRNVRGESFFERVAKKGLGIERGEYGSDALTMGLRYENGAGGVTVSPPVGRYEVPFLGGYVLPKVNIMFLGPRKPLSVEALYAPSAARSFDWYVSAGPEWFRPLGTREFDVRFVSEGGLRFRFDKKQHFGARIGVRTNGFWQPREPRLIIEFGAGAF